MKGGRAVKRSGSWEPLADNPHQVTGYGMVTYIETELTYTNWKDLDRSPLTQVMTTSHLETGQSLLVL